MVRTVVALGRRQPRSAAPDRLPVDEDGARAADALAAAGLRPGDVELLAQDTEEAPVRLTRNVRGDPVDDQAEGAGRFGRLHVLRLALLAREGLVQSRRLTAKGKPRP